MDKQEKNYTCGCAITKYIIFKFENINLSESELEIALNTDPKIGTHPNEIINFFKERDYEVIEKIRI